MMSFIQNIKGVIFDVDGVLLDSLEIWTDLGERYLVSIGKAAEEGLADALFSMSMEQGAAYLKEHYSVPETTEKIYQGLQDMLRDFYYFLTLGLLAPYLERACFLLATPAVSRVPLMMWYLTPGRSLTLPPLIRTTLCS